MKAHNLRYWLTTVFCSTAVCAAIEVGYAQEASTSAGNDRVASLVGTANAPNAQSTSGETGATSRTTVSETPGARPESVGPGLEEITVTARKREESLLRVPVDETVVTQQAIEQYQTHDLFTLEAQAPGLLLSNNVSTIPPTVSLRGIGTVAVNASMDQSVSLNIDGLQLSQGYAYTAGLFDVGKIEVLKGPQVLYFGKNSPAGVISLRSADPTDKTEVIVNGGYEVEAQEKLGEVIVSGPVSDWLKLRLAAHVSDDNGYFRDYDVAPAGTWGVLTPGTTHYDTEDNTIIRFTALFNPSTVYDARLKWNYTNDLLDHGGDFQQANCPNGRVGYLGLPLIYPNQSCTLNRNVSDLVYNPQYWPGLQNGGVPFADSHQDFGTLEQNLHLPHEFTLTSVTGYYRFNEDAMVNGSGNSGVITLAADNDFFNSEVTEDLRLTSNFTDFPVNFMVGGFYQGGRMENDVRIYGNTVLGLPLNLQKVNHIIDIDSISGFGQMTWNITNQLELSGGARWTTETRTHTEINVGTPGAPLGISPLLDPYLHSTNTSPEATLTYRPTDDLTVFGAYKTGFKSGSFNSVEFYGPTTPTSFGEEKVKGGEIGIKSRLLDRHLTVDLAGYYYKYSGLQVGADEISPTGLIELYTQNAASAEVKGIDFDAAYSPPGFEALTLRTAVSYNRATYVSFPNAPCDNDQTISQGCNQLYDSVTASYTAQNLAGRPLAAAPKWAANTELDYKMPVGRGMGLAFGGLVTYTSSFYTSILDLPTYIQGGYTKVNANISLNGPGDTWQVSLIGNNLTDKIVAGSYCANGDPNNGAFLGGQVSGKATGGPAGADAADCVAVRGREVWLRLTWRPLGM